MHRLRSDFPRIPNDKGGYLALFQRPNQFGGAVDADEADRSGKAAPAQGGQHSQGGGAIRGEHARYLRMAGAHRR